MNLPTRQVRGGREVSPLVQVTGAGCVVQTVKLAEDRSGDVVVRLYESNGGRTTASVRAGFDHAGVTATNLLEEMDGHQPTVDEDGVAHIALRPFQIVTLRFARGGDQ
jgi:alpha-mannosidase